MNPHDELADRFEAHRGQLHQVAYRMLGSPSEADDAVQEAWLRLERTDVSEVQSLGAWLRTVVSRVCLDQLRSRASRREEPAGQDAADLRDPRPASDPEQAVVLADSVGRALLVVLDTLVPAERIAFVLHDMFAVPFDEIAPVVERSPATAKKLASRARQKVRGAPARDAAELTRHRRVVETFLAAARAGDVDAVIAVLAPDAVRRADRAALPAGRATQVRGARNVAARDRRVRAERTVRRAGPHRRRGGDRGRAATAGCSSPSPSRSRASGSPATSSSPTRPGSPGSTWPCSTAADRRPACIGCIQIVTSI